MAKQKFLTRMEVATRLHLGITTLNAFIEKKQIVNDAVAGKTQLFSEETVSKFVNSRAYKEHKAPKAKKVVVRKNLGGSGYPALVRWSKVRGEPYPTYEEYLAQGGKPAKHLDHTPHREVVPLKIGELAEKTAELVIRGIGKDQAKIIAGLLSQSVGREILAGVRKAVQEVIHAELVEMLQDDVPGDPEDVVDTTKGTNDE
jgi:hypothetical protein